MPRWRTGNSGPAAARVPVRAAPYLDAAPVDEVMFEQLGYLLAHRKGHCPNPCAECSRLEHIKFWLLAPFRGANLSR